MLLFLHMANLIRRLGGALKPGILRETRDFRDRNFILLHLNKRRQKEKESGCGRGGKYMLNQVTF
jgi:hypothetical protein